jgi:hypothetical protein
MDIAQDQPDSSEAENDTVAKDGYCVECEGVADLFMS